MRKGVHSIHTLCRRVQLELLNGETMKRLITLKVGRYLVTGEYEAHRA
jgi:hypothetical protein